MANFITADEHQKQMEEYKERLFKLFGEGRIMEEELLELLDK